jgi:hypothetical protein
MLEGTAGPPDYLAMSTPRAGPEHRETMLRARTLATFGVMVSDSSRGRVLRAPGRGLGGLGGPLIRYDLDDADTARFKRGIELLCDIYWAAGARELVVPIAGMPTLHDGDSGRLREARVRARDLTLMAFHPLGTARAGADPARAVLDGELAVHGVRGLYVSDGSVVPSSRGVNPQITIMTLATRLAFSLLGEPAPADEPAPERIARPAIHRAHVAAGG